MEDRFEHDCTDTVSVDFAYTDEFGSTTQMSKTVESDYLGGSQLDVVCDLFKDFVLACGFTYLANKRIEWVDDKR